MNATRWSTCECGSVDREREVEDAPDARTSTSRYSVIEHGNLSERGSAPLRGRHTHTRYAPGTAALFTEPGKRGGIPPWAGDFRPATDAGGPKNAVGKTFTLELPDGRTGKVLVQSLKTGKGGITLALLGEDVAPF